MSEQRKHAVVLIGPIGSGKSTQADLLSEDFGIFHFETSKIIWEKLNKADPDDKILQREKEIFKSGKLVTPEIVKKIVIERVHELAQAGKGIVFSGSPRTVPEAKEEIPVFEQLYGKENVYVVYIALSEEEVIRRNSKRRICKQNEHPIPNFPQFENIIECPRDGSEIITRLLDAPEKIRIRYKTYIEETKPVIDIFRKFGYKVLEVNGEQSIEAVHEDIVKALKGRHVSMHVGTLDTR